MANNEWVRKDYLIERYFETNGIMGSGNNNSGAYASSATKRGRRSGNLSFVEPQLAESMGVHMTQINSVGEQKTKTRKVSVEKVCARICGLEIEGSFSFSFSF